MNKQAEIDWPLVMKLFAGGALTGAGLGAGTSFMRYLQSLQDQARTDTSSDDDVLYLNLPDRQMPAGRRRKMASTATFATGGLAGILGTLLAYNAVRGAYQKVRKKQLQRELDQAQQIYLGSLTPGMGKAASQFSALSKGVGSAYLALILAALGSGVVANRVLQKQFPPVKNPNRQRPRKIVIRSPREEEQTLQAQDGVTPDALEGLVRTASQFPKVASADAGLVDLIHAVAQGRGDEFVNNVAQVGVEAALDLVKGARHTKSSNLNRNLAMTWICSEPMVATAMEPLIAAEFHDGGGAWLTKLAMRVEPRFHADLVGLSESAVQGSRRAFYAPLTQGRKIAMDIGPGMFETALLSKSLGAILGNGADQTEEGDASKGKQPGSSDTPVSRDSSPVDVELGGDEAKRFWNTYGSAVDNAVAKV